MLALLKDYINKKHPIYKHITKIEKRKLFKYCTVTFEETGLRKINIYFKVPRKFQKTIGKFEYGACASLHVYGSGSLEIWDTYGTTVKHILFV